MADIGNRMYCHSCEGVWSQDGGLTCPHCHSEFTEIIEIPPDPDTPPPEIHHAPYSPPINPWADHNPWAQQETHDGLPFDFMDSPATGYAHRTYRSPDGRFSFSSTTINGSGEFGWSSRRSVNHPNSGFSAMLHGLDVALRGMAETYDPPPHRRSPGPEDPFDPHLPGWSAMDDYTSHEGLRPRNTDRPQPRAPPVGSLSESVQLHQRELTRVFTDTYRLLNLFQDGSGTHRGQRQHGAHGGPGPNPLAMLSSLLDVAGGDGVHSQEEFDRIISELIDQIAHAPGTGAPPATRAAIGSLPKKTVDQEMLGTDGKVECSICIEDVELQTEVTVLPCTHWFHSNCIELWLSQHNTCPHCRRSIDSVGDAGCFTRPPEDTRRPEGTSENPLVIQDSREASPAGRRRRSSPWSLRSGRSSGSRSGPSSPTRESSDSNRRGSGASRGSRESRRERGGIGWFLSRIVGDVERNDQ